MKPLSSLSSPSTSSPSSLNLLTYNNNNNKKGLERRRKRKKKFRNKNQKWIEERGLMWKSNKANKMNGISFFFSQCSISLLKTEIFTNCSNGFRIRVSNNESDILIDFDSKFSLESRRNLLLLKKKKKKVLVSENRQDESDQNRTKASIFV